MPSIPIYRLALMHPDADAPVVFAAGGKHEIDLVADIVAEVARRPVGAFRSKASVLVEVEAAIKSVLRQFKVDALNNR